MHISKAKMSSEIDYTKDFARADTNHDGGIDEKEFRSFLGPENQTKDKARDLTQYDVQAFAVSKQRLHFVFFFFKSNFSQRQSFKL